MAPEPVSFLNGSDSTSEVVFFEEFQPQPGLMRWTLG